jgi:hypothetical protein
LLPRILFLLKGHPWTASCVPVYTGVNLFMNKLSIFINKPALHMHWLIHEYTSSHVKLVYL